MDITAMINERAELWEEINAARQDIFRTVGQAEGKTEIRLKNAIAALREFDDKVNKQLGV